VTANIDVFDVYVGNATASHGSTYKVVRFDLSVTLLLSSRAMMIVGRRCRHPKVCLCVQNVCKIIISLYDDTHRVKRKGGGKTKRRTKGLLPYVSLSLRLHNTT